MVVINDWLIREEGVDKDSEKFRAFLQRKQRANDDENKVRRRRRRVWEHRVAHRQQEMDEWYVPDWYGKVTTDYSYPEEYKGLTVDESMTLVE